MQSAIIVQIFLVLLQQKNYGIKRQNFLNFFVMAKVRTPMTQIERIKTDFFMRCFLKIREHERSEL
jgi:hypothetical protein